MSEQITMKPTVVDPDTVTAAQQAFARLQAVTNEKIIGQHKLVERLLMALLTNGHLLVEGAPGLAKTTAIKVLAERIEGDFHRIQFIGWIIFTGPPGLGRIRFTQGKHPTSTEPKTRQAGRSGYS